MAKFDIGDGERSAMWSSVLNGKEDRQAICEPAHPGGRLGPDSTRMRQRCNPLGPTDRGIRSPVGLAGILACFLGVIGSASADPSTATVPDPPAPSRPPSVGPGNFRASSNLDGLYLWLGPTGAASRVDGAWDSTVGGHAAVLRIREGAPLGVIGGVVGATLWTERGGGRIWLDAIAGTRLWKMVGVSAGPLLELSDQTHPRFGGSVGIWGFVGVTPFARVGVVEDLGGFAEIGVHIALPVLRR